MKRIVVAIPHSHTWFWTQTCLASLQRFPPVAEGYEVEVVVVDNSPWSPAIRGVEAFAVQTIANHKENKFHASALDCIVEKFDFDYLMALETDVLALRPDWLQWFLDQMRDTDFAVGHWHHEQFINPSCTLYRGNVLRDMQKWCKELADPELMRWGDQFVQTKPIADRQPERDYRDWFGQNVEWVAGPFADKRGWPAGTMLREPPSGQLKGPGWYEPGQMLHHWAVQADYTYTICPTQTTQREDGLPLQTMYGGLAYGNRALEADEMFASGARTTHTWGGTRALDIVKHEVTCNFVKSNTPFWLEREARFWKAIVPLEVQQQTLKLVWKYGWHYRGAGTQEITHRDREAVKLIRECYARGGVEW